MGVRARLRGERMSGIIGGIWTVAAFLGGVCVVLLLAVVAVSLARGIFKGLHGEDRGDGRK
jgi:hypothetical protein